MMRHPPPCQRCKDEGFTLLELIIALGIMALGVALVFPYFEGSRAGHQLRATAYDIATQLRDARATAQARNVDQAFIIDVGNRRMWLDGSERRRYLSSRMAVDVEVPDRRATRRPTWYACAFSRMAAPAAASWYCATAAGARP